MRSLSTEPTPPRNCPSPAESGRNSWRSKKSGKRASATSTLPNLIPPAAWPSPAVSQPSPAAEAPPPARDDAIGTGGRQRLDDGLRDLLSAVIGGQGNRRRGIRIHDRPR